MMEMPWCSLIFMLKSMIVFWLQALLFLRRRFSSGLWSKRWCAGCSMKWRATRRVRNLHRHLRRPLKVSRKISLELLFSSLLFSLIYCSVFPFLVSFFLTYVYLLLRFWRLLSLLSLDRCACSFGCFWTLRQSVLGVSIISVARLCGEIQQEWAGRVL